MARTLEELDREQARLRADLRELREEMSRLIEIRRDLATLKEKIEECVDLVKDLRGVGSNA